MCAQISGRSTSASSDATVVVAMPAAVSEDAVDDMRGEGQGKGRPQEGLIHWLVVAAGCCWAGSTQSATGPLAGPAAGSVSCQIPSALYNPSHDLFRSAAVQSYSPPASSDVSSESTLQILVV